MVNVDLLTDLASALEVFFKGMSECGLLTMYSVQLQVTTVDFVVQIKFRCLVYQFMKSLQVLLSKTPTIPGHENSHITHTPADLRGNFSEVKLPVASEPVATTDQLGSLVEACVFAHSDGSLNWTDTKGGVELKTESSTGFVAQNNGLGSITDIIVTCHPAALAAITGHNFITPSAEPVITTECNNVKSYLLKACIDASCATDGGEDQTCFRKDSCPLESEEHVSQNNSHVPGTRPSNEQCIGVESDKPQPNPGIVNELKPFITKNTNIHFSEQVPASTVNSLEQPLVLQTYAEDEVPDEIGESTNVMHILVASADKTIQSSDTESEKNAAIFICEVCEKTFVTARSLQLHQTLMHRNKGQCDMCLLRFATVHSLQEHCKTDHGGIGCFNCPVCNRRFMTKLSYNRHMDTHGGKKGAVCDICGKTFSRTDYLQKHYMTHNGTRPFTCPHCPRKFISSYQLKVHERTHSGVKEYVCNMCNKAFSRGDKLKDHILRHLNIKRFQCSYCKREFAEKRDLAKHLKACTDRAIQAEEPITPAPPHQVIPVLHLEMDDAEDPSSQEIVSRAEDSCTSIIDCDK